MNKDHKIEANLEGDPLHNVPGPEEHLDPQDVGYTGLGETAPGVKMGSIKINKYMLFILK